MDNWKFEKLKFYCKVESGYPFKTDMYSSNGVPILKIANIDDYTTVVTKSDDYIPTSKAELYKEFELTEGDIVIAMSGNTTCKMGRVSKQFSPSFLNQRVGKFKIINDELLYDFIYYVMISESMQRRLWNFATATGQPNLSPYAITKVEIPIPPKHEQRTIATILSKIDEAIAATKNSINKAESLKKALMQNLLTGKLKTDGTWRKEDEFYKDEKFGEMPKSWQLKRLGDCFDFFPTSSYSRSILLEKGECKYIHYGDIHTKYNGFLDIENAVLPYITKEMEKKYTKVVDGDLILADASEDYDGVGKAIEIKNTGENKVIAGLHTLHLRDKDGHFVNGYKGYLLNHWKVRNSILKISAGIKVYSISKGTLSKILLPIPSPTEQKQIANKLSLIDNEIDKKHTKIQKLERLKKALMQNLLTGKLRVKIKET